MPTCGCLLRAVCLGAAALLMAGCSSGAGLTTGSLFGSEPEKVALPTDNNTPTGRALHVGRVAARATKCGYNFDAAALRTNYLAAEAASGMAIADLAKIETIYDTGYRGVMSAAASEPDYCNSTRTTVIKTELNKVLAADFSPPPRVVQAESGILGGLFDQDVVGDRGPSFGSDDWWENQRSSRPQ